VLGRRCFQRAGLDRLGLGRRDDHYGWWWWFTGTDLGEGWDAYAQVDVPGGGFFPDEDMGDYYFHSPASEALPGIASYLQSGYGVGIGLRNGGGGHAITVWGYNYNPSDPSDYYGIWVTDSDDNKSSDSPPDRLRYYEVEYSGGKWYLQDYYGSNSWYIGSVQALAPKPSGDPPPDPPPPDPPAPDPPAPTDLGTVDQQQLSGLDPSSGELWYRFQASRHALLTITAQATNQSATVELYDSDMNLRSIGLPTKTRFSICVLLATAPTWT